MVILKFLHFMHIFKKVSAASVDGNIVKFDVKMLNVGSCPCKNYSKLQMNFIAVLIKYYLYLIYNLVLKYQI